jgi:predicted class III extradiol MEMO1 family dioxygenase
VIAGLRRRLGDKVFANRYDHEHEHSIELQLPWIQHVFGPDEKGEFPKVFGALIHDPSVNSGESYDGKGISLQSFVDALREVIGELPGQTLIVSSADLSHAGPAFGDQQALAGEEPPAIEGRTKVFKHDREMIELLVQNKPAELVAAMAWMQNPTRWCSIGNLVATMMVTKPSNVRLLNYSAAMDEAGTTMVSSASMMLE